MTQRWYEIPEETVALMAERSAQGDSFSKIGEELGIDRRVVAKAVRQFNDTRAGRANIRSDALAEVWREHLNDMETAAVVFVRLTASPSLRGSLLPADRDIESALPGELTEELSGEKAILWGMEETEEGRKTDLENRVERRLAERRARAAFDGLKEHIPALEDKIKEWQQSAATYKETWDQLRGQAIGIGISDEQIEPSVKLALKRLPAWGEEEDLSYLKGVAATTNDPEHFANILLQRPATKRPMQLFWQSHNDLEAVCRQLEEMLSRPQLKKALVTSRCQYCPVE